MNKKKKEDSAEKKQKEIKLKQSKRKEKKKKGSSRGVFMKQKESWQKAASKGKEKKKRAASSPLPFDQLHALFLYHTTQDYFSIGALRSVFFFSFLGSSRSPWTEGRQKTAFFQAVLHCFLSNFFSLAHLFL